MQVSFHEDPADIAVICSDLKIHGVVFVNTTRTNFRLIADKVQAHGVKVLPLAVMGPDGDFHNYLLHYEDEEYEAGITDGRVLNAIVAWQAAGSPCPHVQPA